MTVSACPAPEVRVNLLFLRGAEQLYLAGHETGAASGPGLAPATEYSAGVDLRADLDGPELRIRARERQVVPTGVAIEPLSPGIAGFVYSRSGLGAKHGLTVAQGVGVIDPDYRGELTVWLLNTADEDRVIRRGDRIAQLVFQPFLRPRFRTVRELGNTARGAGGFGHTGVR